jgi:hypothetical protein
MMMFSRSLSALCLVLCLLLAGGAAALAQDRAKLSGYEDFVFGMSEAELRNKVGIVKESNEPMFGGTWLTTDRLVEVDGEEYRMEVMTIEGSVAQVNLGRTFQHDPDACKAAFQRMVRSTETELGAPDSQPEIKEYESSMKAVARFSFKDGGVLLIAATAVRGSDFGCIQNFAYRSKAGIDLFNGTN